MRIRHVLPLTLFGWSLSCAGDTTEAPFLTAPVAPAQVPEEVFVEATPAPSLLSPELPLVLPAVAADITPMVGPDFENAFFGLRPAAEAMPTLDSEEVLSSRIPPIWIEEERPVASRVVVSP